MASAWESAGGRGGDTHKKCDDKGQECREGVCYNLPKIPRKDACIRGRSSTGISNKFLRQRLCGADKVL